MFISKKKFVALAASVAIFAITATSLTPAQAAPKNLARAVVQPDWLEKNLDDPKVVVVEVSTEPGIYERGHIKIQSKLLGTPIWLIPLIAMLSLLPTFKNSHRLQESARTPQSFSMEIRTIGSPHGELGSLISTVQRMSVFLMVAESSGRKMDVLSQQLLPPRLKVISPAPV